MFQPARLNRAMVASCKLPLGMPSLRLLATSYLFLVGILAGRAERQRFGKATDRAFVANESVALDHHTKQQRIVVAVGCGGDDAQAVAAGFAFHPQFLAGAAPEGDEAGLKGFCIADGVEKAQHQHFAGARILHNAGREAVHLVEIDCGARIAHGFPWFWLSLAGNTKKPAGWVAGGLGFFDLSGRLHQALAVRRHGGSMMMVMTVMAVALHLNETITEDTAPCQPWLPSKLRNLARNCVLRLLRAPSHVGHICWCRGALSHITPHPLAGRGEVEVLAANREVVEEGDAAAGWMASVRQIFCFKQGRSHQANFGDFSAHAVDLNPIADAYAILAHKSKPSEKRENKILHCDRETGGGQAQNRGHLLRPAEDNKQDEQATGDLYTQLQNGTQGLGLAPVERWIGNEPPHKGIAEDDANDDKGNQRQRLKNQMP